MDNNQKFKMIHTLPQKGIMKLPDEITEYVENEEIEGICKYDSVSNYLLNASATAFAIEAAGQYAEILIRNSEVLDIGKLFLAEVKDLKICGEISNIDIYIKAKLIQKFKNIYKSYVEIYTDYNKFASGYLIHISDY